jgi:ketosteroid isomerase-like protein
MEKGFAERFAKEWVAAWNSHDLERILAHYEDDFEMSSPIITTLVGEPSGKLRGKMAVAHIGPRRFNPYQTSDSNCSRRWQA